MSKVDPTQDYYAALEISPDASEDEIRKQYRKLALKLHPDRHPGKEAEFQPRFQQIQAAYECLTDPEQRRKYEVSRRMRPTGPTSTAPRPGPSGQRGNPYKASSNFPPPPRPPGAPPRRGDAAPHPPPQPPPRSGAERYTNFPNPPPRRAPEVSSARSDAKARANVFNAWQNMNNAQKTQAQRAQGYAVPPAWDGPRTDSGAASPRSAYDTVNGQQRPTSGRAQSSRNPPRAHHQQDSSAPSGDDSSTPRQRDRPFGRSNPPRMTTDFPPRVPPRAAPTAKRPEGASGGTPNDEAPFTEGSRERTPYSSTPGERSSFFAKSDSIRRTASVRDATKLDPRLDPRTGRPRSVSPSGRAENNRDASHTNTQSKPRPQPSRASSGRQWMHYSESSDASSEDELPAPRRASYVHGAAVNPADRPKARPSSSWQKRRDEASPTLNKSKSYDDQKLAGNGQDTPGQHGVRPQPSIFNMNTGVNDPRTFSNSDSPQPGFTTQFSPTGGPPPVFSPTPPRVGSPKSAYVFPAQVSPTSQMPPPRAPSQHVSSEGEQSAGSGRDFRPEGWQQAFSQENWASQWAQPPQSKSSSPTRPSANSSRRARAGIGRSQAQMPPRPTATSEAAQAHLEEGLRSQAGVAPEDDAMDIDEELPPMFQRPAVVPDTSSDVSSSAAASAAPRQVYGEPPRPEWNTSTTNNSRRPSASNAEAQSHRPAGLGQEPLLPPPSSSSSGPDVSLSGFRHVLPGSGMPSNGAGIRNLADLSTALPFHSRPSPSHPAKGPLAPSESEAATDAEANAEKIAKSIPRPPLAPLVPSNLNKSHWDTYLAQMTDYIAKWNSYNARMVAHFQDFAVSLADYSHARIGGDGNNVLDNWLGVVGETQSQKGWDSYMRELKEDGIWRTAWAEASQRHAEAVARHHNVRERLREKMERGW